ncbi:MAG: recombination regulator RecX [Actinomycetota bacterium]|nr:recombination regulator RecX [Actinomycetota bacterium]
MSVESESALDAAYGVLRHRERSTTEVRDRLAAAGYLDEECKNAIETLVRTGLLDDARFAELRARSLAERGAGDGRIRHELESAGIPSEIADTALGTLGPEADRARSVVMRRGPGAKTARYLHGKGFSHEIVAAAIADSHEEELG